MRRCPVCEKERIQGSVCDNCGFDLSCDYEGCRTLCSALPKDAEPISARAAKWRQRQQKQAVALAHRESEMLRCPVCEKEQIQGSICDGCGFDTSCDYESHRTLYSTLPKQAEPISVRAAKWMRQRKQMITLAPGVLVCPKCGRGNFSFLINEMQYICADCGWKKPVVPPKNESVSESDPSAKHETAVAQDDPPVIDPSPAEAGVAPASIDEEKTVKKALPMYGQEELTAIICVHCGLVNPDNNYVCDHCAKRLWQYSDPNAPKNVFLFGFRGFVRRYDHIKVDAVPLPDVRPTKPPTEADAIKIQPTLQKKTTSQSVSTKSLIAWGRTKEEREKADRAFDILTDKS